MMTDSMSRAMSSRIVCSVATAFPKDRSASPDYRSMADQPIRPNARSIHNVSAAPTGSVDNFMAAPAHGDTDGVGAAATRTGLEIRHASPGKMPTMMDLRVAEKVSPNPATDPFPRQVEGWHTVGQVLRGE